MELEGVLALMPANQEKEDLGKQRILFQEARHSSTLELQMMMVHSGSAA
jgi:hypothetical protein